MIAAFPLALVLLGLQTDPRVLHWPLGEGTQAFPLRATYGQLEGDSDGSNLHLGIDIAARSASEMVYAIESGMVRRVEVPSTSNPMDAYFSGIVVESASVPGRALLYLHLEPGTIQVKVGDTVAPRDPLGQVVYSDPYTGVRHLHLSRLEGDVVGTSWEELDSLNVHNPLALFDPAVLGDGTAPVIEQIRNRWCRPRENEDSGGGDHVYPSPSHIHPGDLDLLVRVYDQDDSGSTHLLAPYRIELKEVASGTLRVLLLDDALTSLEPEDLYNLDDAHPSCSSVGDTPGRRYRYFLVATNAAPGASAIDTPYAWTATTGSQQFELTVLDVAGNSARETFTVDVESSP